MDNYIKECINSLLNEHNISLEELAIKIGEESEKLQCSIEDQSITYSTINKVLLCCNEHPIDFFDLRGNSISQMLVKSDIKLRDCSNKLFWVKKEINKMAEILNE